MQIAWLLLLSVFLFAATPPKRPAIVSIEQAEPPHFAVGQPAEYVLELKILKGFHIQANPASEKYLIPLTIKFENLQGVATAQPAYPAGIPFRLKGSDRDILTYEDRVKVKIPLRIDKTVQPGDITLKGTLRYQGCDDSLCFPPVTMPLELKFKAQ